MTYVSYSKEQYIILIRNSQKTSSFEQADDKLHNLLDPGGKFHHLHVLNRMFFLPDWLPVVANFNVKYHRNFKQLKYSRTCEKNA